MVLAEEALTWLEAQPDADAANPVALPRAIHRLRVSFDKAAI
jgi:hypothetical protein